MLIDRRLVDEARGGGAALEALITAVWPEAYRIAFAIVRDRGLAEDAAQDACARIAASLSQLNDSGGFVSWSSRIAARHAIDAVRRRKRFETLDAAVERAANFDTSEALDLYEAMASLPVIQRAAIVLHYYAGFSSSEIAAATGQPASTIRFHLMLARRTLRKALSNDASIAAREEIAPDVH